MIHQTLKSEVLQVIADRHSVKYYQPGHKIPKEDLQQIIISASQAPSSWNLQHWKFLIIDDPAQREKLLPIAFGQKQIVESSVVIAVLGDLEANKKAEIAFNPATDGEFIPKIYEGFVAQIEDAYQNPHTARDEAIRNGSLAAMQLMIAAKAMGYESSPLGGYDVEKFVEAFHVPARYLPVMLITVGLPTRPARRTTRLSFDQITISNTF